MELTLSLAHFCESHGPTSILCTQALPISCFSCHPRSIDASIGDLEAAGVAAATTITPPPLKSSSATSSFDFSDVHDSSRSDRTFVGVRPASNVTSAPAQDDRAPTGFIEKRRPWAERGDDKECESCSISIPNTVSSRLPEGAPGSPRPNGMGRLGSPVLRSRVPHRVYDDRQSDTCSDTDDDEPAPPELRAESFGSNTTASSFHEHTLTYITSHTPIDPSTFSDLRRAIVRTLSGEQLPRGLTSGRIFFGDPVSGYTIAYNFRLADKYARGGRRLYSLVALAGYDTQRAYNAVRYIWSSFEALASWIIAKTDEKIKKNEEAEEERVQETSYVPVSSFLTGRTMDPDGYLRRNGPMGQKARALTEMTGDEHLFAELHSKLVSLLQKFS